MTNSHPYGKGCTREPDQTEPRWDCRSCGAEYLTPTKGKPEWQEWNAEQKEKG